MRVYFGRNSVQALAALQSFHDINQLNVNTVYFSRILYEQHLIDRVGEATSATRRRYVI